MLLLKCLVLIYTQTHKKKKLSIFETTESECTIATAHLILLYDFYFYEDIA